MMPAAICHRCGVSQAFLAALPPSLTTLHLHQCYVAPDVREADFPPQLTCTSYELEFAEMLGGTSELADGVVISRPRRQLAPVIARDGA